MIQSILLENFLAHKRTKIMLGQGMTVLTGANNCGKSAVVEGLRCVSQNPKNRHFIRHGAKEARVTVTVDDGTQITWIRKKATVVYEVLKPGLEPEVYRKLRMGQVPEEVLDLLRLDPVELTSGSPKRVDLHIGDQRKPIFLLADDSADARMAEFFASSTEGAHLISMQKRLKAKMRENKTMARTTQQTMDRLGADLDMLAPLPGIEQDLVRAGELNRKLEESSKQLPQIEGVISGMVRMQENREQLTSRAQVLQEVKAPPQVHDTRSLELAAMKLKALETRIAIGRGRSAALDLLTDPPTVSSTKEIVDTVQSIKILKLQIKKSFEKETVLHDLQEPPVLFDEQPLSGLVGEVRRLQERLIQLQKVREAQDSNLERLEADIGQRTKDIGNCPLCNGKMDIGTLLGTLGGHKEEK